MKLEKSLTFKPTNKKESSNIIVGILSRVLSNKLLCHYKCHMKTRLVLVNFRPK